MTNAPQLSGHLFMHLNEVIQRVGILPQMPVQSSGRRTDYHATTLMVWKLPAQHTARGRYLTLLTVCIDGGRTYEFPEKHRRNQG